MTEHRAPEISLLGLRGASLNHKLHSIQVLRGIAAVLVVIYHSFLVLAEKNLGDGGRFDIGAMGVDIFFVISGFVMFWTTRKHTGSLLDSLRFYKKRIARIVPLYWTLTIVVAGTYFIWPGAFSIFSATPAELIKSLLFIPYFAANGEIQPLIGQGWTLNYEMFFYLVFGLLLVLNRKYIVLTLAAFFVSIVVIGEICSVPRDSVLSFYFSPLLVEFCAGVLLAYATLKGRVTSNILGVLVLLSTCMLYGFFSRNQGFREEYGHEYRALIWGGTSYIVVQVALWLEPWLSKGWSKVPLLLGDASYSIYVSHMLVLVAVLKIEKVAGAGLHIHFVNGLSSWWMLSVFAIIGGMATYWLLERNLTRVFQPGSGLDERVEKAASVT